MRGRILLFLPIISVCLFLYGIYFAMNSVDENMCKMTYMYEHPQFVKINLNFNWNFSKYGLYAYSEGYITKLVRAMKFTGAPVIFVPGNRGSYKQVRSLASVALRKGIDNNWKQHLDYFTIDYDEEYSALFGGYLEQQEIFLKKCIRTVLDLYKMLPNGPKQVVLIGHSMGGKIAQSVLTDSNYSKLINTIITLASPMDEPVLNIDTYMNKFYRKIENYFVRNAVPKDLTENCNDNTLFRSKKTNMEYNNVLDDKLLITIGGGNRDFLVRESISTSKYSDIHAMTTSIPNVWLSTDHLCSVWCLQLILTINRFLYSTLQANNAANKNIGPTFFVEKKIRLEKAIDYFVQPRQSNDNHQESFLTNSKDLWIDDSRRIYSEKIRPELNRHRFYMIRLIESRLYKMLAATVINLDIENWAFGCAALEIKEEGGRICENVTSLSHLINTIPSDTDKRQFLLINLQDLKKTFPSWTHVFIHISQLRNPIQINVDVHDPVERSIELKMPTLYSFKNVTILEKTIIGSSFYRIKILDLVDTHQTLSLSISPVECSQTKYRVVVQICIPWVRGSKRYQQITEKRNAPLYIYTPKSKPEFYKAEENPITVDIHLDPSCRFEISYQNSLGFTMWQIVEQYSQNLPAHFTTILLLDLKYQMYTSLQDAQLKYKKLQFQLQHFSSSYTVIGAWVLAKCLSTVPFLNVPENLHQPLLISLLMNGTAYIMLKLITRLIMFSISICHYFIYKLLFRSIKFLCPTVYKFSNWKMEKIPTLVSLILISIAYISCGEISLICGCCIHYMLFVLDKKDNFSSDMLNNDFVQPSKSEQNQNENKIIAKSYNSNKLDLKMTILLLYILITILNFPTVVFWAKHYSFSTKLISDPSTISAFLILISSLIIWQWKTKSLSACKFTANILDLFAITCLIYCENSVYRLNGIISAAFITIAFQSLYALSK